MPDHIRPVCDRAVMTAIPLGLKADAHLAAVLHDLGKYSDRFLDRLKGLLPGLNHSSAGARAALDHSGAEARPVALAIAGHHVGIPRGGGTIESHISELDRQLAADLSTGSDWRGMVRLLRTDGVTPQHPCDFESTISWTPGAENNSAAEMLDVRLLFSTLVDADYIETEAHFDGNAKVPRRARKEGIALDAHMALQKVLIAAELRRNAADAKANLVELREIVRRDCLEAGKLDVGLFTLTAPTGSGKTLAMLAFALAHAAHRDLSRVIMVIPYLTIIDQTARICREIFGDIGALAVVEDHSAARVRDALDSKDPLVQQRQLLAENFDAPIILTTSLNALESLHANDPRRCRKLHHLAKSVILFDEIQTLPPDLVELTLATLSRLSHRFGSSVVFSTATQPAFDVLDNRGGVTRLCSTGWKPKEIIQNVATLFDLAKDRYGVEWKLNKPVEWASLALSLCKDGKIAPVIAIVNLKRHAVALVQAVLLLNPGVPVFHLSTNLCPLHRERILSEISPLLKNQLPMILIATQCIESGVDISAPVVYRALAPLESIAQAAGRCNRHGTDPQPGRVIVFVPDDEAYPPGAYEAAAKQTRAFIAELQMAKDVDLDRTNVLSEPRLLRLYYQRLYQAGLVESSRRKEILQAVDERDFPEVARLYRLINQDTINVLVPYDVKLFRSLIIDIEKGGEITRDWIAKARPLAIGIRRLRADDQSAGALRPMPPGADDFEADWFVLQEEEPGELYDPKVLGLMELKATWFA